MLKEGWTVWTGWALWMAEARVDYRVDHLFQAIHSKPTCPVCPPSLWPPYGSRDIDRLIWLEVLWMCGCSQHATQFCSWCLCQERSKSPIFRAHCGNVLCQQETVHNLRGLVAICRELSWTPEPYWHCELCMFSLLVSFSPLRTVLSGLAAGSAGLSCILFPFPSRQSQPFLRGRELIGLLLKISLDGDSFRFSVL